MRRAAAPTLALADGITCVNRARHGFFISVQSYQVF